MVFLVVSLSGGSIGKCNYNDVVVFNHIIAAFTHFIVNLNQHQRFTACWSGSDTDEKCKLLEPVSFSLPCVKWSSRKSAMQNFRTAIQAHKISRLKDLFDMWWSQRSVLWVIVIWLHTDIFSCRPYSKFTHYERPFLALFVWWWEAFLPKSWPKNALPLNLAIKYEGERNLSLDNHALCCSVCSDRSFWNYAKAFR